LLGGHAPTKVGRYTTLENALVSVASAARALQSSSMGLRPNSTSAINKGPSSGWQFAPVRSCTADPRSREGSAASLRPQDLQALTG